MKKIILVSSIVALLSEGDVIPIFIGDVNTRRTLTGIIAFGEALVPKVNPDIVIKLTNTINIEKLSILQNKLKELFTKS